MSFHTWKAALALAGLVVVFAGCGRGGPAAGEVAGKVSVGGKPVTAGVVKFVPDAGEPVGASLGPDGTYRATGVPAGRSRVAIETLQFKNLTPPPPAMAKQMGGPRAQYVPIPAKYEKPDTSGLSVEVRDRKVVTFDIEMP